MWKQVELRDICDAIIDCVNKTAPLSNYETPYKMLRTPDIRDGFINTENLRCVDEEIFKKWTRREKLQKGDVILTREAPVGEVGFIKDPENLFLGQRLVLYRTNPQKCNSLFLLYSFLFKENKLAILGQGNGSTVTHLKIPDCEKIKIKLPPLETQDKIASVLSAYDNLIENNNKRIKILEQMAENLYKEWFVRFRFPGHETTPIENGIPKGWNECRLGDCMLFNRGTSYSSEDIVDGDLALLSMNNIRPYGGYIADYSRSFSGKYKTEQIVHENDLIMSITDMTQDRRIIGYVGLVGPTEKKCVICTHLMKISSSVYHNYFLYGLFTFSGLSKSVSEQATGTNVLGLTAKILNKIKCVIPETKLTNLYSQKVAPIFEEIHSIEKQNENLIKQRDLLLPRLMSGKLAV